MIVKSKKMIIWIVVLLLLGGGGYYFLRPKAVVSETEAVRRGTVAETISVTGQVVPGTYADLSFQQIGTLTKVMVKDGEQVEKGQVLATIESPVLSAQLHEAQLALSVAEQNEMLARRHWDDLKPEERTAKKLATEQARAQVSTARAQMVNNTLRAPFKGSITNVEARVGETVDPAFAPHDLWRTIPGGMNLLPPFAREETDVVAVDQPDFRMLSRA